MQYRGTECASLTIVNMEQCFAIFCDFPMNFLNLLWMDHCLGSSRRDSVTSRFCPEDEVATCHNLCYSPFWKACRPWGTSLKPMKSIQYLLSHFKDILKESSAWSLKRICCMPTWSVSTLPVFFVKTQHEAKGHIATICFICFSTF